MEAIIYEYIGKSYSSFPLPFVLVFVGYAFILLIDKVLIDAHSGHDHKGSSHNS